MKIEKNPFFNSLLWFNSLKICQTTKSHHQFIPVVKENALPNIYKHTQSHSTTTQSGALLVFLFTFAVLICLLFYMRYTLFSFPPLELVPPWIFDDLLTWHQNSNIADIKHEDKSYIILCRLSHQYRWHITMLLSRNEDKKKRTSYIHLRSHTPHSHMVWGR